MGEKHQRDNNKPQRKKDGYRLKRLTWLTNDELENFGLNFSRCENCEVVPMNKSYSCSSVFIALAFKTYTIHRHVYHINSKTFKAFYHLEHLISS